MLKKVGEYLRMSNLKMLYNYVRSHKHAFGLIAGLCFTKALQSLDFVILSRYENSFESPPVTVSLAGDSQSRDDLQPLFITECTSSTPTHYAPCFAKELDNVVSAEELIYPGFRLAPPIFATERLSDKSAWWDTVLTVWERAYAAYDNMYYPEQHGQVIVFENMTIDDSMPFDKWVYDACSGTSATPSHLKPYNGTSYTHERALIANTADSRSLQHFLDRASHVYIQAMHHHPDTIITGRKDNKVVDDLWAKLGFATEKVLAQRTDVFSSTMVWSCRVPTFHPWLTRKFLSQVKTGQTVHPVPMASRKEVMYMTRSNDRTRNPGRKVVNERELLSQIQRLLDERGQGEILRVFDHEEYEDTTALIEHFETNVRAVIGPHGGAMLNHIWTGSDTLVLELQPIGWPNVAFYETVRALDQQYAILMLEPVNEELDMVVDVSAVLQLLNDNLGKALPEKARLRTWYHWRTENLESGKEPKSQ